MCVTQTTDHFQIYWKLFQGPVLALGPVLPMCALDGAANSKGIICQSGKVMIGLTLTMVWTLLIKIQTSEMCWDKRIGPHPITLALSSCFPAGQLLVGWRGILGISLMVEENLWSSPGWEQRSQPVLWVCDFFFYIYHLCVCLKYLYTECDILLFKTI